MAIQVKNPLTIYVDTESQKDIIKEKGKGIYELINGKRSFKVSIKEYEELSKEPKEALANANKQYEQELQSLEYSYNQYENPHNYASKLWNDHLKEGWTDKKKLDENYEANKKEAESKLKELKEKKAKLKEKFDKKIKPHTDKADEIKAAFNNVVWMYQLTGNNLPTDVNADSFNEKNGIGTHEWSPEMNALEIGGGFTYIQPYLKLEGYIPEINLKNGAIYFAYGTSGIKGASWYEDNEGKVEITKNKKIAFGSTVYLLVKTQDLYGQIVQIQFKDDDSFTSKNEADGTDDDLGVYDERGREKICDRQQSACKHKKRYPLTKNYKNTRMG